jgi:hypothetical protein
VKGRQMKTLWMYRVYTIALVSIAALEAASALVFSKRENGILFDDSTIVCNYNRGKYS